MFLQEKENEFIIQKLIEFIIFILVLTFLLYLLWKGEKPGFLSFKNNYYIFFMAILPAIIFSFSYNYSYFYVEENVNRFLNQYIQESVLHSYFIENKEDKIDRDIFIKNMIYLKTIIVKTLFLTFTIYFTLFTRKVIDKGFISKSKFSYSSEVIEKYVKSENNIFFNLLGILIGGLLFAILYIFNLSRFHYFQFNKKLKLNQPIQVDLSYS
jgi:hypothetical protein